MGCRFCASTLDGLTRNLLPSEMLEQIYRIQELSGERVSNIVIMGTGEPMDNYDNVVQFLRMVSDDKGICISQRNITVSTCGLVPRIRQLAEEQLQITLALSLHAPNDEKRQELMPIARKYTLDEVLDACRYYFEQTGRRLTFEYSGIAVEHTMCQMVVLLLSLQCEVTSSESKLFIKRLVHFEEKPSSLSEMLILISLCEHLIHFLKGIVVRTHT